MFRRPEYNVRSLAPSIFYQKNGDVRFLGSVQLIGRIW